MTYQKDQTGILQSATKAAAELTAAELAAGIIKSHDTALERFDEIRAHVLVDLTAAVTADNAMFKAEEAATPAKSGGNRSYTKAKSSGNSGGGSFLESALKDPGAVSIKGGKFDGCTVAAVYAMPGTVTEDYGYVDRDGVAKPGSKYIQWMTTNDKNPSMQAVSKAFLEGLRSDSDAA